jgi:putative ABC transport system permease protein
MSRLAWSQLRFRPARLAALLIGMLVATTAFTVLTAASRTSQLRTVGTISAHFVPAYDILVRPHGARTALEKATRTVQPDYLSGIYGGITMAQYHRIQRISGVQVAAPIAMIGYSLLLTDVSRPVPPASLAKPGRQLYRVATTWVSAGGTSRVPQPASYLYITPNRISFASRTGATVENLPDGGASRICPLQLQQAPSANPFGAALQSGDDCWSKADGLGLPHNVSQDLPTQATWGPSWVIPVLMAAVDPAAEAKLDGLNHALISGRYLSQHARQRSSSAGSAAIFPVLAASAIGLDEYAVTELQSLPAPAAPPDMTGSWRASESGVPGTEVSTARSSAQQAYRALLANLRTKMSATAPRSAILGYWSSGPTRYRRDAGGALTPLIVRNPARVWYTAGARIAPMDDADNQYRALAVHAPASTAFNGAIAVPQVVGVFSPSRIKSFDPLSRVPLGAYQPIAAAPATAASRTALGGADLLPNLNLGGLVSQPVDLITSLSALPALQNTGYYGTHVPASDPISAIRVRVAGVTGPNPVSLERIREVAQQIAVRTQLTVDIVAGSSPSPTTIALPAGKFGQPALTLREDWVKKGVAVAILTAIDKNSLVLFILILVVCVLFVTNSAAAAVRGRRRELGVLACLGWTRARLFGVIMSELAATGLVAGLLGAALALPLAAALGLHAAAGRAMLAVPVAVGVAIVAGFVPAWLAARAEPVASVRPPVLEVQRGHQPGGVSGLAAVNVLRTPGRALLGAVALAVGIAALTLLLAVSFAFRGVLVGSLLGDAVAVQVRGVDYIAVIATITLGVLAVADVLLLNIRERAGELATIRALGWRESALSRLIVTEGAIIGLAGSLTGAALGLVAAANFAGHLPARLYLIAAIGCAAGVVVTAAVALLPAQALRRLPAALLLAEE